MEENSVNDNQTNEQEGKKKISLQEAMKQQLANKAQAQGGKASLSGNQKTKKMKSQLTKKPNNQRKRMGV
ncbi:hypothetical protein [Niallia sp.]|uniref:hypothetical protein n=1 Tax=Niallia sp. TaxID=2837523 RepID=UPI00289C29C4|nr:hypothetical protein [Niallia sp.]